MHYHCEVWLPEKVDEKPVEALRKNREAMNALLESILAPYGQESESRKRTKFWDYWKIGGRWTGNHDGYDPSQDWVNYATCRLCKGSGVRDDMKQGGEKEVLCNSCKGTGASMNYTAEYHINDVMQVRDLKDALTYYTLVISRKKTIVLHSERWMGMKKGFKANRWGKDIKKDLAEFGIRDGWVVTVDCHC